LHLTQRLLSPRQTAEEDPTPTPTRRCPSLASVLAAAALLLPALGVLRTAAGQAPPPDPVHLRQQAEQLRREQRLPEALAAYRAVVVLEPESFEDRFWVAKLESWTGRLADADSAFVQLLAERPDDYDSRIALADVRLWRGETDAAREILEGLRRSHPDDPEILRRLDALRRPVVRAGWEADLEYFGERLPGGADANGATLSLAAPPSRRLRWRAAATVQEKFDRTESRFGGEVGIRPAARLELSWSAFVAPGAEVLPRGSYGAGASYLVMRGVVFYADYAFLDYQQASVHQAGPALELYAGPHWLVGGRYRYAATRFAGSAGPVDNHAGSLTIGYLYGPANLVRIFGGVGGESFSQPSRELIGRFEAHTVGLAWRHFLTPGLGLEAVYAHQAVSGGDDRDSYGLRVLRRW
jgi:YaiO family outer membrane protein